MNSTTLTDKDILDYVAPDGVLIPQRCTVSVLTKHGFYEYILNRYNDNSLNKEDKFYLRETIYRMFHHIEKRPVCKICGKPLMFANNSYPTYCSRSCSNKDEDVLKKMSVSCSKSLKSTYEKNGEEIKRKRMNTLSQKYGVDLKSSSPFGVKEIQDISRERVFEKYGVDNVLKLERPKRTTDLLKQKSILFQQKENNVYINPLIKLKNTLDEINPDYILTDDMIFDYQELRVVYLNGFFCSKSTISKDYLLSFIKDDKRTIFVYDYEITDERKFDIIISNIKYALHKVDNRIFARKCVLKEISNKESREFLMKNSLFGYRSASVILGLYYQDELVMVYSFGNNYYGRNGNIEVIRVCTKKDTQVIGGSSKCLKYYIDKYGHDGDVLVFYVDAIHHNGNSMMNDGFDYKGHEFGFMNYYITPERFGEAFNRNPKRNKEIKEMVKSHKVIEVLTNGVDVYKKIIRK